MQTMTPENRACLERANRIYYLGNDDDHWCYVAPDGRIADDEAVRYLDSGHPVDVMIGALARALHRRVFDGVPAVELRDDLVGSGVREEIADEVVDHVGAFSGGALAALHARALWYDVDDTASAAETPTTTSGVT